MDNEQLRKRTKAVCLKIFDLLDRLPNNTKGWVIGKQLARASSSVAANYRAACCARSKREFYAKICIVVEEADETIFWLEMTGDSGIVKKDLIFDIMNEAQELVNIFSATRKTTALKLNLQSAKQSNSQIAT